MASRHRRQHSEPPELASVAEYGDRRASNSATRANRRHLLERGFSSNDVTSKGDEPSSVPSSRASLAIQDMAAFQESWATTSSTDFLGGRSHVPLGGSQWGSSHWDSTASLQWSVPSIDTTNIIRNGPSSAIHDAARVTGWETVLELCRKDPEAAGYVGGGGWTALHHACNRRCPRPEVVEALLEAYPDAILMEDMKQGWLPLHLACRFKAPKEVVRLLLHRFPKQGGWSVRKTDNQGRTPLFYAIRYDAPPGVVKLLLQMDPSVVLEEDRNDDSPLGLVWNSWVETLEGKRIVDPYLLPNDQNGINSAEQAILLREYLRKEKVLSKRWEKANMLLKAAFGFPVDDSEVAEAVSNGQDKRKWRIVHATAAVKCHFTLFQLACALHPEQVAELDDCDLYATGDSSTCQTALHLAAASNASGEAGKAVLLTLLSLHKDATMIQSRLDGSLPFHLIVENPDKLDWAAHGAILYHFNTRAVRHQDFLGRLPLHRAAAAICHMQRVDDDDDSTDEAENDAENSVVSNIVRLYPQAASVQDENGYQPLHHAVQNAYEWDDSIELIHTSHRLAVQTRANGSLPLHLAAASKKAGDSVIQHLLGLYPLALDMLDAQGCLAMHLGCYAGKEWDQGISFLFEARPESLRQPVAEKKGWLPLHFACASDENSSKLICELVEHHPEAACVKDDDGNLPLHLACQAGGKSWKEGLERLFHANAIATSTVDGDGLLPLHVAAFRVCGGEDLDEERPSWLADTSASKSHGDLDVLYEILRADPAALR